MRISAKADYAMRALLELAATDEELLKGDDISDSQGIPFKFLEKIMSELKTAGIVFSQRGAEGGYSLVRPAAEVNLAEIMRAIEGPIAIVRDTRPENLEYEDPAKGLTSAWVALREQHEGRPRIGHARQRPRARSSPPRSRRCSTIRTPGSRTNPIAAGRPEAATRPLAD